MSVVSVVRGVSVESVVCVVSDLRTLFLSMPRLWPLFVC